MRPTSRSTGSAGASRSALRRPRAAGDRSEVSASGSDVGSVGGASVAGPSASDVGVSRVAVASRRSWPARSRPDQDLAKEALESGRFASLAQGLDRDIRHRACRIRRRERPVVEPLRRTEEAGRGDDVRVAGPTRERIQVDVGACPGTRRQASAGRQHLDDRRGVVVGVGQSRADQPVAGGRPTQHRRDDRLGPGLHDLDHPPVASHRTADRLEGAGDLGRLPAPRDTQRATSQGVEREQRRRLATEHPAGAVVGGAQPVEARAHRRLADHEPDARRGSRPPVRVRVVVQRDEAGRTAQGDHASWPPPRRGCAGPRRGVPGSGRRSPRRGAG